MAIGLISIVITILNLWFKKSKPLYVVLFIWMWIIMAFTYGIADEIIYISRYNQPQLWALNVELLQSAIILFCNKLGMRFALYKTFITFIQLVLIFFTVWKFAKYPNLVVALYFFYPFPLNVAQMRYALATAVFIFGCRYLISDTNIIKLKKINLTSNDIKYIMAIIIASLIHSASIMWLVLLVAKKMNLRNSILFTLAFNIVIFFFLSPQNIMKVIGILGAGDRIGAYFTLAYLQSEWRHYGMSLMIVLFTAFIMIGLCLFIINRKRKFENLEEVKLLLKINISILCILSIILKYTGEAYRLQEGIAILNYMLITNSFKPKMFSQKIISLGNATVCSILLIYMIGIVYIALLLYLIPTIIVPLLQQNTAFDFIL